MKAKDFQGGIKHVTTMQPRTLAMVHTQVTHTEILNIRCFADFQVFKEMPNIRHAVLKHIRIAFLKSLIYKYD